MKHLISDDTSYYRRHASISVSVLVWLKCKSSDIKPPTFLSLHSPPLPLKGLLMLSTTYLSRAEAAVRLHKTTWRNSGVLAHANNPKQQVFNVLIASYLTSSCCRAEIEGVRGESAICLWLIHLLSYKFSLRYWGKECSFLTAHEELNLAHTSFEQWSANKSEQTHTHTHTACRQDCVLPAEFQRLCIHSVFAFHPLPGYAFIIHPSSEKHLKWLYFSAPPP